LIPREAAVVRVPVTRYEAQAKSLILLNDEVLTTHTSSTFTAFLIAVLVGARRFAHASLLRGDRALQALLGMDRFPTDDTIRNLYRAFAMGEVQRLYEPIGLRESKRFP
jgi:hypothetical protein